MSPLRALDVALALATYASFVWAVRSFFVCEGPMRPGMRAIAVGGTVTMVAHLAALAFGPSRGPAFELVGAALYGCSLLLFWGAVRANRTQPLLLAFSEERPEHLVTEGPYAVVRHPFYSAYLTAWIAGLVATLHPLLLPTVVGMGALYHRAARLEEAMFADSPMAEAYRRYRQRAGMFTPRLRALMTTSGVADPGTAPLRRR